MEQGPNRESPLQLRLKQVREIVAAYKIGATPMHQRLHELGIGTVGMSFLTLTDILLHDDIEPETLATLHTIAEAELAKAPDRIRTDALYNAQPRP
jgi:hypothetical protein